ncbi:MAG: hypothetical protein ABEJ31_07025 [Haloarculaceae archaeon]
MPTCTHCGADLDAADLVRHETERLIRVHCPECETPMGAYRLHGQQF